MPYGLAVFQGKKANKIKKQTNKKTKPHNSYGYHILLHSEKK